MNKIYEEHKLASHPTLATTALSRILVHTKRGEGRIITQPDHLHIDEGIAKFTELLWKPTM